MTQGVDHLKFKLAISGTFWDRRPAYEISINDNLIKKGEIAGASDEIETHEFEYSLTEGRHRLSIRFLNKTPDQTVKAPESTDDNLIIARDMLLNVHTLEVDGIEVPLGADYGDKELFGVYRIDEPVASYQGRENVTELMGIKNMGWNGRYDVDFYSPFYLWILENL